MGQDEAEDPGSAEAGQNGGLLGLVLVLLRQLLGEVVDLAVAASVVFHQGAQPAHLVVGDPRLVGELAQPSPHGVGLGVELDRADVVAPREVVPRLHIDGAGQAVGVVDVQLPHLLDQLGHARQLGGRGKDRQADGLVAQHVATHHGGESLAQLSPGALDDLVRVTGGTALVVLQADDQVVQMPRLRLLGIELDELLGRLQRPVQAGLVELLLAELDQTSKACLRHKAESFVSMAGCTPNYFTM